MEEKVRNLLTIDNGHSLSSNELFQEVSPPDFSLYDNDKTKPKCTGLRHTPELGLSGGGCIQLPSFSFCVVRYDERLMLHFLRDKFHSRILKSFPKHRITKN